MTTLTRADFVIRGSYNISRAVNALRDAEFSVSSLCDEDIEWLAEFFNDYGFDCLVYSSIDEFSIDDMPRDCIDRNFEKAMKTISKAVEPGSFLEFSDDGDLFRYVFLYDVVEKWSVPHVLFEKKEAI